MGEEVTVDINTCLNIGAKAEVKTCHGKKYFGEILAVDRASKLMFLKCKAESSNGVKSKRSDIVLINIAMITSFNPEEGNKSEASSNASNSLPVNIDKLEERLRLSISEKQRRVSRVGINVPKFAQECFDHIAKQYQCSWESQCIIVEPLNIRIQPPYTPEAAVGPPGAGLDYIRKILSHRQKSISSP